MSHFIGLVFGENVNELLSPYDEGLEVDKHVVYTKEEAINEAKENKKYIQDSNHKIFKCVTDEDFYNYAKDNWGYEVDSEGNFLSTYNEQSKWDWYEVGGRWNGYLPTGETGTYYSNSCKVSDVNWEKYYKERECPFCFVTTDGEWCEKGEMGFFAVVTNPKPNQEWSDEFKAYVESLDPDTLVTAIDFHI